MHELFAVQIIKHIQTTKDWFRYTPTKQQVYEFAESLYNATFKELIDKKYLEAYKP